MVSLANVWSGLEGGQEGPLGSCSKFFHFGLLPKQQKAVQRLEMRQGCIQSVVALPHGLLYCFTEMYPPECGGVGSQWEEDIHYTRGMQSLRLGAFILPTTRNTTILLLKPCNAGLKRKPQSCSCVHLGAISPVCTWAAGRQLLARKEPSELLEGLPSSGQIQTCLDASCTTTDGGMLRGFGGPRFVQACLSDPCLRVGKGSGLHSGESQT